MKFSPSKNQLLLIIIYLLTISTCLSATIDVSIVGLSAPYYSPGSTAIKVGDTIRWTNNDASPMNMSHTVTSDNGVFDSGPIAEGNTYQYTFTSVGIYPYHCSIPLHQNMKATTYVSLDVDTTPPANITGFKTDGGDTFVQLGWTNPSNTDFAGTRIRRKVGSFPSGPNDGTSTQIFQSTGTTFIDSSLTNGQTYYYGAYTFDTANLFSSGAFSVAIPQAPQPPSISGLPYIRLNLSESLDTAIDLDDYNRRDPASSYSIASNFNANASVDGQGRISYGSNATEGTGAAAYIASNSSGASTTGNIIKYSTYRFKGKLPRVIVDDGLVLENSEINLAGLVTPDGAGAAYSISVQTENGSDNGKVSATLTNATILSVSLNNNNPLVDEVRIFVTISTDSSSFGTDYDTDIVRVHEVINSFSQFDQASDTTEFGYEDAPGTSNGRPTVTWLPSYNGESGVVRFQFNNSAQGLKATLGSSHWENPIPGEWYTLRMRVTSSLFGSNGFVPSGFIYNGLVPGATEVSGIALIGTSTTWMDLEISIQAEDTGVIFPQYTMKNGASIGNLYLSSLEIIKASPGILLARGNTINGPSSGTWNNSTSISGWGQEPAPNASSATLSAITGVLNIFTSGSESQGIKMTAITNPGQSFTLPVVPNQSVGMQTKISSTGTLTSPVILLAMFGETSQGGLTIKELAATAALFRIPSGTNGIFRLGYNVMANPYVYPQFQVKNNGNGNIYLDDTFILIDRDLPQYTDSNLVP